MEIYNEHLNNFRKIKNKFLNKTRAPKYDNWKHLSDNQIWHQIITQVIVVGSSIPADKFLRSFTLKRIVSYKRLSKYKNEKEIQKSIHHVLLEVGARYASKNINKCKKTKALTHNFKILSTFKGGPKGLLKRVSELRGPNGNKRKIRYFMKVFNFIKSKSARDILMQFGLIREALALDIRVQNIMKKVGIKLPKGFVNNPKLYDEVEKTLLNKICRPLNLSGVQFDRMLYQNYDGIKKLKF